MKILIYGAGTIGMTYGWLLSQGHEVEVYVKERDLSHYQKGISLLIKDLRRHDKSYQIHHFAPKLVTSIVNHYDLILLTVNSSQIKQAAKELSTFQGKTRILIMQNNWDTTEKIFPYLDRESYSLAFPSSVGGGRKYGKVKAIIFQAPTLIDEDEYHNLNCGIFEKCHLSIKSMPDLANWLKIHCLQEAVMAGAIAESGSFDAVLEDSQVIKKMILAWREGILLCEKYGISKKAYKPTKYLFLPLCLLIPVVKLFLKQPLTQEMIRGHLASGYQEWADQYREILETGKTIHFPMPIWQSYQPFIENYKQ